MEIKHQIKKCELAGFSNAAKTICGRSSDFNGALDNIRLVKSAFAALVAGHWPGLFVIVILCLRALGVDQLPYQLPQCLMLRAFVAGR